MISFLINYILTEPEVSIEVLTKGDGVNFPKKGQTVIVHYVGTLTNGKQFDSSKSRNEPFNFQLGVGQVIKGWDITVAKMSKGESVKVTIPYQLAYGERGIPPQIPAKSDLVFEIDLLDFK